MTDHPNEGVGYLAWEEFERFRTAVHQSLTVVPWFRVAGHIKGQQPEGDRCGARGTLLRNYREAARAAGVQFRGHRMSDLLDPDCRDGKHQACTRMAWDEVNDRPADCECACHEGSTK